MQALKDLYAREPVRCVGLLVAVVVGLAAKLGLVIDPQNFGEVAAIVVPLLLGAEAARSQVTPARTPLVEGGVRGGYVEDDEPADL